jgi:hypothetical protein
MGIAPDGYRHRATPSPMVPNKIEISGKLLPIDRFGKGRVIFTLGSSSPGDEEACHFCCYTQLSAGTIGVLVDRTGKQLPVRITERSGNYYNAHELQES